ncbi:MAG: hypothetical protein AAF577_08165 [Pseudomonadota bacterium]
MRIAAALAVTVILAANAAQAYHQSCGGGQVLRPDRCSNHPSVNLLNIGTNGFLACASNDPAQGEVQYDFMVIFAGLTQYVCTHYHSCAEVQSVQPNVYNAFCT